MPVPGPGYAIIARVEVPASASASGDLTMAVVRVGGVVDAFDVAEAAATTVVVNISLNARDEAHANEIDDAVGALPGVHVRKVSDGRSWCTSGASSRPLEGQPAQPRRSLAGLHARGGPGLQAIAANPVDARRLTIKPTPWPWSPTDRRCSGWATLAPRRRCR